MQRAAGDVGAVVGELRLPLFFSSPVTHTLSHAAEARHEDGFFQQISGFDSEIDT